MTEAVINDVATNATNGISPVAQITFLAGQGKGPMEIVKETGQPLTFVRQVLGSLKLRNSEDASEPAAEVKIAKVAKTKKAKPAKSAVAAASAGAPKRRGRPPGSKNKSTLVAKALNKTVSKAVAKANAKTMATVKRLAAPTPGTKKRGRPPGSKNKTAIMAKDKVGTFVAPKAKSIVTKPVRKARVISVAAIPTGRYESIAKLVEIAGRVNMQVDDLLGLVKQASL